MTKTDAQLKKDVMAELEWDAAIDATHVGVAMENGVVALSGHLKTFAQKWAVERAVQRVNGVRALAVELDVRLEPHHQCSDAEIAAAIETAFQWHAAIPQDRIHVKVEKGHVTLTREVDWDYQRHNAESVVRALIGVIGDSNRLWLSERDVPQYVAQRIREGLARYAEQEARNVQVEVDGATATLRGTGHSPAERDALRMAVWSAPGISRVFDELTIAD